MSVRLRAVSFGALIVGPVIAVDPAGLSPFGAAKWLVISTAAAATVAWTLRQGTARCDRRTWRMWTALLALLTVSALANGDARVALLGHPDRHLGVITWVLFFALFCAGQQLADRATSLAVARNHPSPPRPSSAPPSRSQLLAHTSESGSPGTVRTVSGPPGSSAQRAGRVCLVVRTGANRSPSRSTRSSTSSMVNFSAASPAAPASTSAHETGVDTVGSGRARIE